MTAAPDQLACYQRDGFLILKDFVAASVCDDLRARAESLVSEFDPAGSLYLQLIMACCLTKVSPIVRTGRAMLTPSM
ncbi:MAG: hypothetical protein ACR2LM_16310 [Pyrinomonadaceae bacterium]